MSGGINRKALFSKLNKLSYTSIESAYKFCVMRENAYIEISHWIYQILQQQDSDIHSIIKYAGIDESRLSRDLLEALDNLKPSTSSTPNISTQIEETVQQAWVYGSLALGESRIRTGHLLIGMLFTRSLADSLIALSPEFKKIDADILLSDLHTICANSPEGLTTGEHASNLDEAPSTSSDQSALQNYATNLTKSARDGEIDPVVGRDEEIRQIVDILMRRRQNNPILTGEAGVGKTAVIEGFALRIAKGDVPPMLRDTDIYSLDIGSLQAGASMKGQFEERLKNVIEEVQASEKPIILFIDEAHTLIGAGGAAGTGDAANLLKPALARGTLRTLAATTWAEYKKYFEKDPALTRRFQVVQVEEPEEQKAIQMMRCIAPTMEKHHNVLVLDEAIEASVKLSHRYIPARQLPDKSVSVLDTACARVAVSQHATPSALEDKQKHLEMYLAEQTIINKEKAVGIDIKNRLNDVEDNISQTNTEIDQLNLRWAEEKTLVDQIISLRDQLTQQPSVTDKEDQETIDNDALISELHALQVQLVELQGDTPLIMPTVNEQAIASVIADWTGIPMGRMVKNEVDAILNLGNSLGERVLGQQHSLDLVAQRIKTSRAGLESPDKPIGVFMLCGPSGVGKTETALSLAEALYGGEENMITINMSEFQESHTVSTLKGSPPGYVGYGEGGILTEAVRRRPYSVVLLDEVEKAHPDVHEMFFQVFDKGWMEDAEGRYIDFRNTVILLTSNAGSDIIHGLCDGVETDEMLAPEDIAKAIRGPLRDVFPAALLGRLDVIPYYPLSPELLTHIIRLKLNKIVRRVEENYGIPLTYSDDVVELIGERCTEVESGARVVDSIISNNLLPRIGQKFLENALSEEQYEAVQIEVIDGQFVYGFATAPLDENEAEEESSSEANNLAPA
jgi:type VI secretion system protein VasG